MLVNKLRKTLDRLYFMHYFNYCSLKDLLGKNSKKCAYGKCNECMFGSLRREQFIEGRYE